MVAFSSRTITALTALAVAADLASAAPQLNAKPKASRRADVGGARSVPLKRNANAHAKRTTDETLDFLERQANTLKGKYGKKKAPAKGKRGNSDSLQIQNLNADYTYFATVNVGTPGQDFNVILDTGSSDLWVASARCQQGCSGLQNLYDPADSSSYRSTNGLLDITYGSGEVQGTIAQDMVELGGYNVRNQAFGVVDTLSTGILNEASLSGLMGLGWPSIAQTQADPFWYNQVQNRIWSEPLFAFYLARYADKQQNATTIESEGGFFDMGWTNPDHYDGEISYVKLASEDYWSIPLDGITINGNRLTPGGNAAIDTGTSLIGGPTAEIGNLYKQIPGAAPGTGKLSGYYVYPCSTAANVSLTFGGKDYSINPVDFSRPADESGEQCVGSFFALDLSGEVEWIVGDSFLKNVYSVYRSDPPSVGFATPKAVIPTSAPADTPPGAGAPPSPSGSGGAAPSSTGASQTPTGSATRQALSPSGTFSASGAGFTPGAAFRTASLGMGSSSLWGTPIMALASIVLGAVMVL